MTKTTSLLMKKNLTLVTLLFSSSLLFLSGCTDPKTLPSSMTGSFVRVEPAFFGPQRANLEITPTGMTARTAGHGMEMNINGNGPFSGSGQTAFTDSVNVSVLFKSVSCKDSTCRFVGTERCEGTISRDAQGDVTVVTAASCPSMMSGKWLGPASAQRSALPPV
jgi:hypothetical protein